MRRGEITGTHHYGIRNAWAGPEHWVTWEGRPPTVMVDRFSGVKPPRGYFPVYAPEWSFDWLYADWYAWPWEKAKRLAYTGFWQSIHFGFRHGLIHPTSGSRGERIRIRGLRLGRCTDA